MKTFRKTKRQTPNACPRGRVPASRSSRCVRTATKAMSVGVASSAFLRRRAACLYRSGGTDVPKATNPSHTHPTHPHTHTHTTQPQQHRGGSEALPAHAGPREGMSGTVVGRMPDRNLREREVVTRASKDPFGYFVPKPVTTFAEVWYSGGAVLFEEFLYPMYRAFPSDPKRAER